MQLKFVDIFLSRQDLQSHRNNPSRRLKRTMKSNILGPNHEALFLVSVMGTKIMLRSWKWSGKSDAKKMSLLEKRISAWSREVVVPELDEIVKNHKMPDFAREVVKTSSDPPSPALLHTRLLINASKHLIELCRSGLGAKTIEKIKEWFGVMATTSSSRLCELPPGSEETKITNVIHDFRQFEIHNESLGESGANKDHPEYPYFDPHSLYIQVAYMVYFYTNSREIARPPFTSVGSVQTPTRRNFMYDWESLSGELFDQIFRICTHGLHIADEHVKRDYHFSLIKLPYTELREHVMAKGVPSVDVLHNMVMCTLSSKMSDISTLQPSSRVRWRIQTYQWTMLCAKATSKGLKFSKSTGQNREKALKNYIKCSGTKPYKPRCPDYFERDIHIMGKLSSLYYLHFDPVGKVAKPFVIF